MSAFKGTPGPWWASATREVFNPAGRTVCRAHLDGNRCSREEALANAKAISAVPQMVEALAALVSNAERVEHDYYGLQGHEDFNVEDALQAAREALKAAGVEL